MNSDSSLRNRAVDLVSRVDPGHVEVLFLLILLGGVLYQVVLGFKYPRLAGHFPVLVGVPTAVMILYVLRKQLWTARGREDDPDAGTVRDRLLLAQGVFWVLLLFGLVVALGLTIGCTVFLALYYRFKRELGWVRLLVYVVVFLAFVFLVFQTVLEIPLYEGVFNIPQEFPV